jgi:hypothetical protein
MLVSASRGGRWPLALTLAILGACAEESTAPTVRGALTPHAIIDNVITVTTASGGKEVGSLRWAVASAAGGEIIRFDPSLAGATINIDSTIPVKKAVTIEGPTNGSVTINGGGTWLVFSLQDFLTSVTTFRNLAIVNGVGSGSAGGGAVLANSDVQLENVTLSGHKGDYSAALYTSENATLINSTVSGNTTNGGQAVALIVKQLKLVNTTIANNNHGGVDVVGSLVLENSILAGNGTGENCLRDNVPTTYVGQNVVDDGSCGGAAQVIIADAKLDSLKDNGGPGKTHALLSGSPAIDAGTSCTVTKDQRYVARDAKCDAGSFEFADFTLATIAIDASGALGKGNGWATITGTVKCTRAESFSVSVELSQLQKNGKTTEDVHGAATVPVSCGTNVMPWSASVYLTSGIFKVGSADVTVQTVNAPGWVKPASASGSVKLLGGR